MSNGMNGVWAVKQFMSQSDSMGSIDANIAGYFARMPWRLIQTGPNTYNWTAFDNLIAAVNASNKAHGTNKKVRLAVMFGANSPYSTSMPVASNLPTGWLTSTYSWFQGSVSSIDDTANAWLPVPWDPKILEAQTKLIHAFGSRYKNNPTVLAFCTTGPSTKWAELALPNNTPLQPGWVNNSISILKTWTDTLDKWNAARGTKRVFTMVSAVPTFYTALTTDLINAGTSRFGTDRSVQWDFLDTKFAVVKTLTNTWKPHVMVGWQSWGLTTNPARLVSGCDTDYHHGSQQDADAVKSMIHWGWDSGATYIEVYDSDLSLKSLEDAYLIRTAAETMNALMVKG